MVNVWWLMLGVGGDCCLGEMDHWNQLTVSWLEMSSVKVIMRCW